MAARDRLEAMRTLRAMAASGSALVCLLHPFGRPSEKKVMESSASRRVLMLSWESPPRIVGGIARHVFGLSQALARAGAQVDVLTAYHPGTPEVEVTEVGRGRVRVLRAAPNPVNPIDFISDIHQLNFLLLEQ